MIKDGSFSLLDKKVLLEDDSIEVVLVDITECLGLRLNLICGIIKF